VSVTTDGFIMDIQNLEIKLLNLPKEDRPFLTFLTKYRELRFDLVNDSKDDALVVKHEGKGVISLTTRGS